jgi:hypothetical protein
MAIVTPVSTSAQPYTAEGGANEEVTLQVNGEHPCRLLWVGVSYSTQVTKNVTVKYVSPLGTKYNVKLYTIALSTSKDGFWLVDGDLRITASDYFEVKAPAGGEGVTATITAFVEPLAVSSKSLNSRQIQGSVSHSTTTGTIGALPPNGKVTGVEIEVATAFNSDNGNTLTIGHDADHSAYMPNIDVSTTGVLVLTLTRAAEGVVRAVKAYYTAGGTAATGGSANITVKYEAV